MGINVRKVSAFRAKSKDNPLKNSNKIQINCPDHILKAFQNTLKGSKILGTSFDNPYREEDTETFPKKASQLTARHLQVLARNELYNCTGKMNFSLYDELLTNDQIARIRCLVKSTTVSGAAMAYAYGGFHSKNIKFATPEKMIIIDQSGLQWQQDFRNTGGLVFYPKTPKDTNLPEGYAKWQKDMYQAMYRLKRPAKPSENVVKVQWHIEIGKKVSGVIDLDLLANAIEVEFRQALEAVVYQGELELEENAAINFKFLKAGMGFFAEGLVIAKTQQEDKPLMLARLKGIEQALFAIYCLPPAKRNLGKVKRLEFPFSYQEQEAAQETIQNIEKLTKALGLEWGGMPQEDALTPKEGYVNATTNCGDPHAMIGNEGKHQSVDASISTNADVTCLNAAYNTNIKCNIIITKNPNKWVPLMYLLTIASGLAGAMLLGPVGIAVGGLVGLSCVAVHAYQPKKAPIVVPEQEPKKKKATEDSPSKTASNPSVTKEVVVEPKPASKKQKPRRTKNKRSKPEV